MNGHSQNIKTSNDNEKLRNTFRNHCLVLKKGARVETSTNDITFWQSMTLELPHGFILNKDICFFQKSRVPR